VWALTDDPSDPTLSAAPALGPERTDLDDPALAKANVRGACAFEVQDRTDDQHARFAGASWDLKAHAGCPKR
jgi:hypothetical protein